MNNQKKLSKTDKIDLKRKEIMKSFYGLVVQDGLENSSLSKIAKGIGIPSSLIFHYFTNKQELVYNLIDYTLEICEGDEMLPLQEKQGGKGSFEDYVEHLLRNLSSANKEANLVYFACRNLAFRDEKVFEKFRLHEQKSIEYIAADLQAFIGRGEIDHMDPMVGASYLYSILNGIEFLADFTLGTEMLEQLVLEHKKKLLEYFKYKD